MRGYRLTGDDELRADLIQQLLCRRRIAIDGIERDYGVEFRRYFAAELARLAPCLAMGLVRDLGYRIEVGSRAWPWLRSIALCFHASDQRGSLPQEAGIRH